MNKKLEKRSITVDEIMDDITSVYHKNKEYMYKHFIHNSIYISEQVIMELVTLGYKVYKGDFDGIQKDVWIIEW